MGWGLCVQKSSLDRPLILAENSVLMIVSTVYRYVAGPWRLSATKFSVVSWQTAEDR